MIAMTQPIRSHTLAMHEVSSLVERVIQNACYSIDIANAEGKRLPITKLAENIATVLGSDKVFCYHIISKYIAARGNLRIKNGPNGGIEMIADGS
jgi:hypothetical protein